VTDKKRCDGGRNENGAEKKGDDSQRDMMIRYLAGESYAGVSTPVRSSVSAVTAITIADSSSST
jgi:hypothetical protein